MHELFYYTVIKITEPLLPARFKLYVYTLFVHVQMIDNSVRVLVSSTTILYKKVLLNLVHHTKKGYQIFLSNCGHGVKTDGKNT
jgi:hypothetical protein